MEKILSTMVLHKNVDDMDTTGPALSKSGNLVPWSAPVARVHPRTADPSIFPILLDYRVQTINK